MGVVEISEAGDRIRLHAGAGSGKATPLYEVAVPDPQILTRPWDTMIIEDFPNYAFCKGSPALKAGMVTVLSALIRFGGRLQAEEARLAAEANARAERLESRVQQLRAYFHAAQKHLRRRQTRVSRRVFGAEATDASHGRNE
jgi:hypothetical protein